MKLLLYGIGKFRLLKEYKINLFIITVIKEKTGIIEK